MCGIAGILGSPDTVHRPVLEAVSNLLAHRGPDDQGIEVLKVDEGQGVLLGLVHRRLSIIDLSPAGHQPMKDEETGNWIVYNGEIYNYQDLRQSLIEVERVFKSTSDTEVVLKAYDQYGTRCLERLRGMFAFAIWDERDKKLFMAVDRFGIKPFYYYLGTKREFYFSSEVRALMHSGLVEKTIEPAALDSFLAYGAVQAPLTIIKGVRSLLPAHYATYDTRTNEMQTSQYWSPGKRVTSGRIDNENDAIAGLREILHDSVNKHLVSDVQVGLFLSGGIDSSSIVATANTLAHGELRSFSVSFAELAFSEDRYSQLVARRYCRNHNEIRLSAEELLGFLPRAIEAMDQPTVDGINTYCISKAVKEAGIRVVLSGQGGDEVFGGYETFKRIPLISKSAWAFHVLPSSLRIRIGHIIDRLLNKPFVGSKFARILESDGKPLSTCLILRQLFSPNTRKLLREGACESQVFNGLPHESVCMLAREMEGLDLFSTISLLELRLYLANMLLRDGDFMSMAHGIEVRVPYLDHELVDYVFSISSHIKFPNSLPKPLLVKTMGDLLPKEIYSRAKMGFTFPWEMWLRDQLRPQIEDLLFSLPAANAAGLHMRNCQYLWKKFLGIEESVSWARVWAIYIILSWCQKNGLL